MKVAIYCRLSEEDRNKQSETDDSESIQNQKSMLIQYATEHGWDIWGIYSDDDYAGADRNRPEFNRLLGDAEKHKFDIVLCKTQSRFTRELEIVEKYIHGLFPLWNVRFVSIVDNADTEIKGNKKARQINGLINEWYLEDMSDNIKSVLTNRRQQGFHIGSFALYGYLKDPDKKGHLIIDEDAAEVVREIFMLYSQGYGKTAIARFLNDKGIPNPTAYKRLKGHPHRDSDIHSGTLWRYYAIADMLINEMYIGNMIQGKYGSVSYKSKKNKPVSKDKWIRVESTHDPIIDLELWNEVQSKVNANFKPFTTGKVGLFARKVMCMNCGYTMRSCKNHGYFYLKCGTKHTAKDACIGSFISVKLLSETVISQLNKLIAEYLNKDDLEQKISFESNLASKKDKLIKAINAYEKKVDAFSKGIKSLYFDKVKGIISDDDFLEFSKDFQADKNKFEKLIDEARQQIGNLDKQMQTIEDRQQFTLQYMNVSELNRDIIEKLIECIYIGRKDKVSKEIPIEINWSF